MEDFVKQMGFASSQEFNSLIASADLSSIEKIVAFKKWQNEDGSKTGLLKLQVPVPLKEEDSFTIFPGGSCAQYLGNQP
jgi:hypothetical protein